MESALYVAQEADVIVALKLIALTFGISPPLDKALEIYVDVLRHIDLPILRRVTQEIIGAYKYPTFPKPAEWLERAKKHADTIGTARLMLRVYSGRRRYAERKYGQQKR